MKFKARNGGLAVGIRNHILMFRSFIVSLVLMLIPTLITRFMGNEYYYVFLLPPILLLAISFLVLLAINTDEKSFRQLNKKDNIFEIKNGIIYKDRKEIKLVGEIKIYCYPGFLYIETSHSMFTVKNTDYLMGSRSELLKWASEHKIKVRTGY